MSEHVENNREEVLNNDNVLAIHNNMMLEGFKLIKEICDIIDQATYDIDKMEKYRQAWKKAWGETMSAKTP